MRTYDRYFLGMVCASFFAALAGVSLLYIAVDFFVNVDQYTASGASAERLVLHYAFNLPPILYRLMPLIVLLGGMFALARILKQREVLPLQVAGLRAAKALRSFWLVALLAAAGMWLTQQFLLGALERARESAESDIKGGAGRKAALFDAQGNHWHVREYNLLDDVPWLEGVNIILLNEFGQFRARLYAARLERRGEQWLGDYSLIRVESLREPVGRYPEEMIRGQPLPGGANLSPGDLSRQGSDGLSKSIGMLWQDAFDGRGRADRLLDLYRALLYPLSALSLLMLGASISLRLRVQNLFLAGALTLVVAYTSYAVAFFADGLALGGVLSPHVAGIGPPLLLLVAGVLALRYRAD